MVNEGLLSALREIMVTPKPWVLFKHHSVVIIEEVCKVIFIIKSVHVFL